MTRRTDTTIGRFHIHQKDWYRPEGLGYSVYLGVELASGAALIVARAGHANWYYATYDGTHEIMIKGGFPSAHAAMHAVQGVYPVKHPRRYGS